MEAFTEDWNASQFWYSDETASLLASQLLDGATDETRIAVVSAPSVFIQLKNMVVGYHFLYSSSSSSSSSSCSCRLSDKGNEQASGQVKCRPHVTLLEYDERFAVFKEFVRYDFEKAIQLPAELQGSFDAIICDPPFLSQDCQTKGTVCSGHRRQITHGLTHQSPSGLDSALASQVLDAGSTAPPRLHRGANGIPHHRETVRQGRHADDRLRNPACQGAQQRVQMLRQL